MLVHRPSGFSCVFDVLRDNYYLMMSPGKDKRYEERYPGSWDGTYSDVWEWLGLLKRELEAPDLWSALSEERALLATASRDVTNAPFTAQEYKQLAARLADIENHLATLRELTADESAFAREQLVYLRDALKRVGRRDWLHTAIGVFFTIVMTLAFNGNQAREFFRFAAQAIGTVFPMVRSLPSPQKISGSQGGVLQLGWKLHLGYNFR